MRDPALCYPALFDPQIGPAIARRMVAAIFVQAVKDGRRKARPRTDPNRKQFASYATDALEFLNQPRTRQLAAVIDIDLPERVTPEMLRAVQP